MPWVVSGYTQNDYIGLLTLTNIDARALTLQIHGAAVITQSQIAQRGWQQETLYPPGIYTLHREYLAFRVKSAVSGIPAYVSIEALGPYD